MRKPPSFESLLEHISEAVFLADRDGTVSYASPGVTGLLGYEIEEFVGRTIFDIHHPDDAGRSRREYAALAATPGQRMTAELRVRHRDGSWRWVETTRKNMLEDPAIRAFVVTFRDITGRTEADAEYASAARGQRILAQASAILAGSLDVATALDSLARLAVPMLADWCTVDLVGDDGRLRRLVTVHEDPTRVMLARELERRYPPDPDSPYGVPNAIRTGNSAWYPEITEDLLAAAVPDVELRRILRGLGLRSAMVVPLRGRDRPRGALSFATAESGRRYDARDLRLAEELAHRAALALENARLHAAEQDARRRAERAADRTARLQAATAALSVAVTREQVAEVIIEHALRALDAAAALSLLTTDESSLDLIRATGYPEDVVRRWRRYTAPRYGGVADALRARQVVWHTSPEALHAAYPEHEPLPDAIGRGARAAVPLLLGDHALGVLYLNFRDRRVFQPEDLAFLLTLGRQCAQALDRAQFYEREHTIAETLQRSLLPARLTDVPGVRTAARYLPASREANVGGDWYDAMPLADGRLALVIGDVAGRGLRAASVMGRLRSAVRACATEPHSPDALVRRLHRMLDREEMATLVYLVLDPVERTASYTNAGHLPPLRVDPEGRAEFLPGASAPLCRLGASYQTFTAAVPDGSTLLLYTDGLVEDRARSTIDEGLERLRVLVQEAQDRTPESLVQRIVAAASSERELDDDVAVMAVSLDAAQSPHLGLRVPAVPESTQMVRRSLWRWLTAAHVDPVRIQEILTAASEACNNAVEHAYGAAEAEFSVEAARDGEEVAIVVRDHGRWRSPRSGRSGMGLVLMQALMDACEIEHGEAGTTVRLRRRLASGVRG
jgi:PAS domain S-box-containing protein